MHAMILSEPGFHAVAPELFKAARRGQFPKTYAHLYADAELNADEYEAIGVALDSYLRMKNGPGKGKRLGRLGVQVSGWLGLHGRKTDDPKRLTLANDLFEWGRRHGGSRYWEAPSYAVLIGYVIGAAEFALAAELPFDPDGLAETAHAAVLAGHLPFSITDVRDTIGALVWQRPMTDWVLPEAVERLRLRTAVRKFAREVAG